MDLVQIGRYDIYLALCDTCINCAVLLSGYSSAVSNGPSILSNGACKSSQSSSIVASLFGF